MSTTSRLPLYCGLLVFLIAFSVMLGWVFGVEELKFIYGSKITMQPITSVGVIFVSFSIFCAYFDKGLTKLIWPLSAVPLLIGCAVIFDAGLNLHLFDRRPSLITAICLVLFAYSNFRVTRPNALAKFPLWQIAIMVTFYASTRTILGYVIGVRDKIQYITHIPMAFSTSICFMLASLAILTLHKQIGVMALVSAENELGRWCRKFISAIMIFAPLVEFLFLYLSNNRFLPQEMATMFINTIDLALLGYIFFNGIYALATEKELREKFIYMLNHDMKVPLTAAKLNLQLKRFEPAEVNIKRIEAMVNDLLDVNAIKAGNLLPIKPESCHLNEVVRNTIRTLEDIHGKRFKFREETSDVQGHWDCNGIQRVIENLVNNAIKYGAEDGVVEIIVRKTGTMAQIKVNNRGEPIKEAEIKGLFQLFGRGEAALRQGIQGWGIGLTLVKGIVEAHQGNIKVTSDSINGTTFTVDLPC